MVLTFPYCIAIFKIAHSVPVHHAHFASWQSRGNPLPMTLPTVPVVNVNGHIFGNAFSPPMFGLFMSV
jgi:hypothetical protein